MTKRLLVLLVPVLLASCAKPREVNGISAAEVACTNCHGDPSRAGTPLFKAAPPASPGGGNGGAHLLHLQNGVACGACHVVPTSSSHRNGVVEVTFSGVAVAKGAAPTFTSGPNGTCSGVYCHGATLAGGNVPAPSWSSGPLACDACHGAPPPSHAPGSTNCNACHPGTVKPDGTIDVAGGLHANGNIDVVGGHPAGFSDPAQHGPAALAGLASCRNCHGANLDGVGGTGPSCASCHYANWQSNCTFCHGSLLTTYTATPANLLKAAPPQGTHGETLSTTRAVGAHQKHLTGGSIGPAVACGECHVVPTDLSHLDGSPAVTFGTLARTGGASPVWNGTTCAASYCHGGTLAGGSVAAPSWTAGSTQTTCGSCHGIPPPSHAPGSTTCSSCHGAGYSATTVNLSLHMNGVIDATQQHPAGWADKTQHGYTANKQGLPACTGCHGTDFNGGTAGVSCNACHTTAGWAAWQTNCTFCHGTRVTSYTSANLTSAAPPVGTEGEYATTTRAVGAHQKHLTGGSLGPAVSCDTCHAIPADLAHVNGVALVTFGAPAKIGGATPGWNGTACASTYCHGGTLAGGSVAAPSWTAGSSQTTCGSCHGVPPPSHSASATSCDSCHGAGYSTTTVNASLHMNGVVDATSAHPSGWADKTQHGYSANGSGLSSCKTCHGANLDGVGGTGPSCTACHTTNGFANWATNCTFCHGDRTSGIASPPVDPQGQISTTQVSVGDHAQHVNTTLMTPLACTACHPDRTGSNVITDATHIDGNGIAEVTFGALAKFGGAAATYTRTSATSATCASVYCHGAYTGGANATVQWTTTKPATCTSCHGLPPSTGHHGNHSSRDCGDCHPGYSRTSVNQATHINGSKEVGNKVTSWDPTTKACVGCHGPDTW